MFKMGQRLVIIKYNEVGELLIGIDATGLWGHICYWDMGLERIGDYCGCPHGEE